MSNKRLVWDDELGDQRKNKELPKTNSSIDEKNLLLKVRRLTAGKGRAVVQITGLPKNKAWCENLAKDLKKALGIGGTFKGDYIELHGEKLDQVTQYFDAKNIKWKKTGG